MYMTVEMLPWIGGAGLLATLGSLLWMIRASLADSRDAARREHRARAAAARRAFRARGEAEEVEAAAR